MIPTVEELYAAGLLCDICEESRAVQPAQWHPVWVCGDCAAYEPEIEDATSTEA